VIKRRAHPMPEATCPHCRRAIEPPPRRSRLCPHCRSPIVVRRGELLTEGQAETFDAELDAIASGKRMARATERYREARASTAGNLKQARASRDIVSGISVMVSENDCRVCQAVSGIIFPVESCTLDMLPPYRNCEIEEGCRACITVVLKPEYSGQHQPAKRTAAKSGGLAGCVMVASILIGALVVLCVCYGVLAGK
jgi:hypothetical protein